MIVFFLIGGVALAILYFALLVILGWILPPEQLLSFKTAVDNVVNFIGKLLLLAIAGMIIYFIYLVVQAPSK